MRKPNLAKIQKPRTHFFLQFSLKGAAHSVSLGLRQLLLRRAVLGGGLPPEIAADINQSARSSHSPRPLSYLPRPDTRRRTSHTPPRKKLTTTTTNTTTYVCMRLSFQLGRMISRSMYRQISRPVCSRLADRQVGGDKSVDGYMDRWVGGSADRWIGESVLRRMAARSERAHPHQQHHQSGPRTRSTRSGNTKTHHADKSAECIASVRCSKIKFGRSDCCCSSICRFVLYGRIALTGESKRSQGGSNSRP